jgi:hypothetical protein
MSSTVLPAAELLEGAVGRRGLDAADAGRRQSWARLTVMKPLVLCPE